MSDDNPGAQIAKGLELIAAGFAKGFQSFGDALYKALVQASGHHTDSEYADAIARELAEARARQPKGAPHV
jgi:hypothetical protein